METDSQIIRELFDLPGAGGASFISHYRDKNGNSSDVSQDYGRRCLQEGDYEGAIKHFRVAIEQAGTAGHDTLLELGAAYESAGMTSQAYRQYLKALKHKETGEAHRGIGEVLQSFGKYTEAIEQIRAAIKAEPGNAYNQFLLAELYRKSGQRSLSLDAINHAISLSAEDSFYHYWMGDLLLEMGRYEEAVASLGAAAELSPGDDKLFQLSGIALWGAQKKVEAIRAIRLASDLNSEELVNYGLLNSFLKLSGMEAEAMLEEKNARKMDKYDQDTMARLLKMVGIEWV